MIVISNNPSVALGADDRAIASGLLDVLRSVRDLVHQGHLLVSHPLAGSVKPNETPYKSVVVGRQSRGPIDFESLSVIEGSLRTAERMLTEKPLPNYPERVLQDFQLIDRQLLQQALESIPPYL